MRSPKALRFLRRTLAPFSLGLVAACTPPHPTPKPNTGAPTASAAPSAGVPTAANDELPELPADPREGVLAEAAVVLLTKQHVLHRQLDDALSKEAFAKYIESIDGAKLFLLQRHVDALAKYETQIDDELRSGDLSVARKGSALAASRRKVVAKVIANLLSKPFDLTKSEEVELDPKKRGFARSEDELRDRWRRVLEAQVLERIQQMEDLLAAKGKADKKDKKEESEAAQKALALIPSTFEGRLDKAQKELAERYEARFVRQLEIEKLEPAAQLINAVNAVYDPHTEYLPPSEKANFDIAMSGTLQGIGAALSEQDHYIVVKDLVPGGASWQQGQLAVGDLILAVAQEGKSPVDVTDMAIDKVVQMIRGPKGTVVSLTVKRPDGRIESISITRDIIKIEASYARGATLRLGKRGEKVGYVYLPGFYGSMRGSKKPGDRNATDDVRALLEAFNQKKVGAVILDLRGNGGGLLDHARDISGLFIDQGPVVQTRDSDGKVEVLADKDPSVTFSGRVVVMVDRFSASATEILAGALQDYERAVIVGTGPTHGKGTVQVVIDLDRHQGGGDRLGVYKITVEEYFRVNGASTQLRGVTPDVILPDPASFVESREQTLFHPIPWSAVDPDNYSRVPHAWEVGELKTASAARVGKHEGFAKLTAFAKLLEARRDDTREPLELRTFQTRRAKEKAELEAVDPKFKDQKSLFDVVPLAQDAAGASASDKKLREKLNAWKDELARDPWVEESLHVLDDMNKKRAAGPRATP